MKKIITLAVLALLIVPAQAQNLGYQGRKTAFYYKAYVTPNFTDYEAVDGSGGSINISHAFEFDFSYNQKNSFGVSYRISPERQYDMGIMEDYYDRNSRKYTLKYDQSVQPTFKPVTMGVFFKFRGYNRFAPLGFHQRLSFYYTATTVNYNPADLIDPANYTILKASAAGHPNFQEDPWQNTAGKSYSFFGLGYELGSQRVINNRYILSYGIEVIIPFERPYYEEGYSERIVEDHFMRSAKAIGSSYNFLSFNMGFGILGPRKKLR